MDEQYSKIQLLIEKKDRKIQNVIDSIRAGKVPTTHANT
jgi:hypothetical protein